MAKETLTHEDTETEKATSSITFPGDLWKRARKMGIDLGVPASQLVVEGLELRLKQLEKKGAA